MNNPFSFKEEPARTYLMFNGMELNSVERDEPVTEDQRNGQKDVLLYWAKNRLERLAKEHGRNL
jgi:hypothetical protein